MNRLSSLLAGACIGAAAICVAGTQTADAQNVGDAVRGGIQRGIQQGVNEGVRSGLGVPTPRYDRGYYDPGGNYDRGYRGGYSDRGYRGGYYSGQSGWRGFTAGVLGLDLRSTQDGQWRLGDITHDTWAYRAGLRPGDRIVTIDGREFRSMDDFNHYMYGYNRDRLPVTVLRDGRQEQIWVQIDRAQRDRWLAEQQQAQPRRLDANRAVLGVTLDNIDGRVVAVDVRENGPAAQAGLEAGDWLLSLNGNNFNTAQEFSGAIERMQPGDEVTLMIARDGEQGQVSPILAAAGDVFGSQQLAQSDDPQRQTVMRPDTESQETVEQLQHRIDELEMQIQSLTQRLQELGVAPEDVPRLDTAPDSGFEDHLFTPEASDAGATAPSNAPVPGQTTPNPATPGSGSGTSGSGTTGGGGAGSP